MSTKPTSAGRARRGPALAASVAAAALLLTACGGGDDGASEGGDGQVTLSISTFNEWGYEELLEEYQEANPDIKIVHDKKATSNNARDNLNTKLAAGSGLSDIEGIEVDWLPELKQYPDQFADLASPEVEGRWLDWKVEGATTEDGKLIGYGTDVGPQAICYRSDLFAAAGLPTDREEVAELLEGDWDHYFEIGEQFTAKSDAAWYDSAMSAYQGMINQVENAYEENDGTVIATENPEVKDIYNQVLENSVDKDLSAHLQLWSDDYEAGFQSGAFATTFCPGWMLGSIEGNAAGVEGWDIANVFPGGGGNWGGSYLTVPTQGKNQEEAIKLAQWLTAPEQQIKAFASKGTFPSQVEAYEMEELTGSTNAFFNDAPVGEILADRAEAVTVTPFKGQNYFAINDSMQQALDRVDVLKSDDPESSWKKFVTGVEALQ
ncbi:MULTISPECIES: ABC transporter substrate-binding protein [unclassified Arthrobacter]|uniref:ABC transporter substrate-binding protein n=1 Tax=unclassified Arthrobacter TaxID=235627 RepID=UPI001D14C779|nr:MULTISPECIES: ABC transporter substrate-binding protein [unclassified Arthrobacter]MCC3290126.1 ABC transporter substrate-binding protein [Arthrobacter sp. zg-Y1110]MCC3300363.1 ABC transporter substrate-binding protein [Arthrobacter sp. zg-Y895]UWX84482.1 ABC transporter substrate-binding protein [Arthrobacter sp. zg-Y1110]